MGGKELTRVRRMARAFPGGPVILDFLCSTNGRQLLTEAAARGIPPVTAVSQPLVELVGTAVLKPAIAKQFAGLVTRAVLAEAGYVPIRSGVRVRNDPIFTAGAIYAKRFASEPKSGGELLKRLLDSLNVEEMHSAVAYLRYRLEGVHLSLPYTTRKTTKANPNDHSIEDAPKFQGYLETKTSLFGKKK